MELELQQPQVHIVHILGKMMVEKRDAAPRRDAMHLTQSDLRRCIPFPREDNPEPGQSH